MPITRSGRTSPKIYALRFLGTARDRSAPHARSVVNSRSRRRSAHAEPRRVHLRQRPRVTPDGRGADAGKHPEHGRAYPVSRVEYPCRYCGRDRRRAATCGVRRECLSRSRAALGFHGRACPERHERGSHDCRLLGPRLLADNGPFRRHARARQRARRGRLARHSGWTGRCPSDESRGSGHLSGCTFPQGAAARDSARIRGDTVPVVPNCAGLGPCRVPVVIGR